jgi:hypothetical protein
MPAGSPVAIAMIGLSDAMAYSKVLNHRTPMARRKYDGGRIEQGALDDD